MIVGVRKAGVTGELWVNGAVTGCTQRTLLTVSIILISKSRVDLGGLGVLQSVLVYPREVSFSLPRVYGT